LEKFLKKTAEFILNEVGDDSLHTVIILPNKRSEVFLKDHLKKLTTRSFWLPEMYSVDEFLQKASALAELDTVALYFDLFDIHLQIAGEDARSLDEFLAWAPVMLSDFNDVDLYLADAEKIFFHLSEIRAMEEWNPEGRELTSLQKKYLAFYRALFDYYKLLNERLMKYQCFLGPGRILFRPQTKPARGGKIHSGTGQGVECERNKQRWELSGR